MATGQTGEDIFNSTPINPDLDGPELLTGESIQSFLTLMVQLQWLVALGRLVTHAQVTTLSKLKLTQKKLQKTYGYILQINEFYWTQSKYYLHETLIKHWDPFKFLKMTTKLLMTVRKAGFRRETLAFCDWNQQNWDWRQSDRADMRGS